MEKIKNYRSFCQENGIEVKQHHDRQKNSNFKHHRSDDKSINVSTEQLGDEDQPVPIEENVDLARMSGLKTPSQKVGDVIASTKNCVDDATLDEIEEEQGSDDQDNNDEPTPPEGVPEGHRNMVETKPHGIIPMMDYRIGNYLRCDIPKHSTLFL